MVNPHSRIAQTSTEAKRLYKKNGPSIPERQRRQMARAAELEERAARIREQEASRKAAKKKREEKERKEREARKQLGVGLATQLIGFSHTQAQLKKGMEAFLGLNKKAKQRECEPNNEITKGPDDTVEDAAKEPWDDDESFDLPEISALVGDQWIDDGLVDDLDDGTLLEVHDLVMSDPAGDDLEDVLRQSEPSPAAAAVAPKPGSSKEDPAFIRLHGPVNKTIEEILNKLPQPLIELLSQDASADLATWAPSHSLLHKLNPSGLPPHRLRVKVGCVVTILRDLHYSSQLSKSQHLQILRVEQERLECFILDGQMEGTKTFLTRVTFHANHRNDKKFPFRRTQFPVKVSTDFHPMKIRQQPSRSTFRQTRHKTGTQIPSDIVEKFRPKLSPNPSFRLPGLPASKSTPVATSNSTVTLLDPLVDSWDDFLDSGTQIARELSQDPSSPCKALPVEHAPSSADTSTALPPLSTQDLDFSLDDIDEPQNGPKPTMQSKQANNSFSSSEVIKAVPFPPTTTPKGPLFPHNVERTKHSMAAPPRSSVEQPRDPVIKRKAEAKTTAQLPHTKRMTAQTGGRSTCAPKTSVAATTTFSFSDFGLSTQEALSFFEDDEDMIFDSPPIAV